jgi:hypothetical protein
LRTSLNTSSFVVAQLVCTMSFESDNDLELYPHVELELRAWGGDPPLRTDGDDGDGKGSRFWAHQHRPKGEAPFSAPQAKKILGPKAVFLDF